MSEQLWYYIDAAEAQHGPITIPQLQALVAAGAVTPATVVWTEALGEQWIPASNVEGLFAAAVAVAPNPETATVAVQAPTQEADAATIANEIAHAAAPPEPIPIPAPAPAPAPAAAAAAVPAPALRAPDPAVSEPQQPQLAPTTPMIPSTPTTQPVAGTAAPIQAIPAPAPVAVEAPAPVAAQDLEQIPAALPADEAPKKGKSILGIILLIVGLGVAGYGGWLFKSDGGSGLVYGLLGGGGVVAILGLIMTLKGKKVAESLATPAAGGFSALGGVAPATTPGAMAVGTFDMSAAAAVAPIPVGTSPVAIKVNPLMPTNPAAEAAAKPSPFAGVQAAAKPNPLLASGASVAPQNKLNTSLPAQPVTPAVEADPS